MRRKKKKTAFALILVLVVVAVGAILSTTYVSSASLRVSASKNFQLLSRARYLAESGLEHAIYALRSDPSQLDGTAASPLGPFFVDDSNDSYTLWAEPVAGQPGQYVLTAKGSVGNIRKTASATVLYSSQERTSVTRAIVVGGGPVRLPASLTINGDFHCNNSLTNEATINGNVTATDGVSDPWDRITGEIDGDAAPVAVPDITYDQYLSYSVDGTDCEAVEYTNNKITPGNPLGGGRAVTEDNAGGVVYLKPSTGDTVTIQGAFNFTGTLVIDGNIVLDGPNISMTAVDGFPAIVATGSISITKNAHSLIINGVVATGEGFLPQGMKVSNSDTTINGAVLSASGGYSDSLPGTHTVNYDSQRASLYDFSSSSGGGAGATVTLLEWND